jgi:hypothetical protein
MLATIVPVLAGVKYPEHTSPVVARWIVADTIGIRSRAALCEVM